MWLVGVISLLATVLYNHLGDVIGWNVKKAEAVCPLEGEMHAAMFGLQEA